MNQISIFIVEDEAIAAASLALDLERNGYKVAGIADMGIQALKKIENTKPDLILMDIAIKGDMDGITVSEKILDKYNIPVVYITSFSDKATLKRARPTQPQAYIVKPYNIVDLKAAIDSVLKLVNPIETTLNKVSRKLKKGTNKFKTAVHKNLKLPSLSSFDRSLKQKKYAKRLPPLSPEDTKIVEALHTEGIYLTSLAELQLPHTKRFLRDLKNLQPQLYTFYNRQGWRAGIPALRKFSHLEIMLWGLAERLLDIIENYIGLPLLFHGVDLRRDVADAPITDARQWHLDIDDERMVKIIIYLNHVGIGKGPFEYIPRSQTARVRDSLNYTTGFVDDEAMSKVIAPQHWKTCTGKAGSVAIVDPCNIFHRAKPAKRNRYSITFGYTSRIPKIALSEFKLSSEEWKRLTPSLSKRQIACLRRDRSFTLTKLDFIH
ncbi:response regulator [Myxosarcina sp. GI1]|uniref:response regulator n=1 Tax=Myxosarcina sp. GI1 TaxID=1541065 RepID=UPI00068B55DE|nr:response regulator [Myxosarcina sp. GI1]